MKEHEVFMNRCIELATLGLGNVAPNPIVGAVLVHEDRIIGEGYHEQFGAAHAEVNCINAVKPEDKYLISEATLYVSLEPCNHFGKTPPCTNLIIENKIKKAVIGCQDPFDKVKGSGISQLRESGIEVTESILEAACQFANRRFFSLHTKKRPYIILKWAQSKEGFIASDKAEQTWLTGEDSKKLVHQWRSEEAAILVGFNTAKIDNPKLTNRSGKCKNPLRLVIYKNLSLYPSVELLNDDLPTVIFNAKLNEKKMEKKYEQIDFETSLPKQILSYLFQNEIQSIIIEGGAKTLKLFIEENLWDEVRVFETQKAIDNGIRVNQLQIPFATETLIGEDTLKTYYNS